NVGVGYLLADIINLPESFLMMAYSKMWIYCSSNLLLNALDMELWHTFQLKWLCLPIEIWGRNQKIGNLPTLLGAYLVLLRKHSEFIPNDTKFNKLAYSMLGPPDMIIFRVSMDAGK
ncbi:hypothetical protein ACJX0J_016323, partial [Zea mays]